MRFKLPARAGRSGLRRGVAAAAAAALGCAGLAAVAATQASAAVVCQVAYSVNQWSTGFTASWNGSLATGGSTSIGANFSYSGTNTAPTAFTVNGVACNGATGTPSPTPTATTATPTPTPTPTSTPTSTPTPTPTPTSTGTSGTGGGSLLVNPPTFSVAQGTTEVFGVSLSAAPTGNITVAVAASGNAGETITSGASLTFTTSNWNYAQPVTVAANATGTGTTTFTASTAGLTSVSVTGTETAAGSTTTQAHVANPFTGSSWYANPDYAAEVATSVAGASGTLAAQMSLVGQQSTGIWLDRIAAIYGGSGNSNRMSFQAQLANAAAHATGSTPIIVPIVVYDLPNRDCAALASNGELLINNNGLQYYEQDYINPIAQILTDYEHTNIRVVAVVEDDSLPNLVTNLSIPSCALANSSGAYVSGIQYALNKLHAIPNVYNYIDLGHSGWLGWPSNMGPAVSLIHSVAAGTTAGVSSVDGFISNTANTVPTSEPFMTATESVDGNPVDSTQFYSFDPYIDELTYDEAMYTNLVAAGFSANVGMLIDTSRNGWGGPLRPTAACSTTTCTTTAAFVNASKIDQRPFRGDWCNVNGAGIGAFPQANPNSAFTHLYAYVWIKPPGESDGDYPTATHAHGDPHCDPNGTQTDGSGNTYPTDAIPGFDIPAGNWFPTQFTQLVQNAFPTIP